MSMSRRQEVREKQRRQQRTNRILAILGISVVALLVVGAMVLATLGRAAGKIIPPVAITRPQVSFNTVGSPNAPVKIIEYADFQCPYCKHFYTDTESQIIDAYIKSGKASLEYQPVVLVGSESSRAAEAAYCAGDQEKFWDMHDIIYTNQGAENSGALRDEVLTALAENIKLDMTKFNDCFSSGKYKSKVDQGMQIAIQNIHTASNFNDVVSTEKYPADGLSTPTFMVNGTMVAGAQPFANFQQKIEAALAAAGK